MLMLNEIQRAQRYFRFGNGGYDVSSVPETDKNCKDLNVPWMVVRFMQKERSRD